jgi:hypothetical protein
MALVRQLARSFMRGFREGMGRPPKIEVFEAKEVERTLRNVECGHCGATGTMEITVLMADGEPYYKAVPMLCCEDVRLSSFGIEGCAGNN